MAYVNDKFRKIQIIAEMVETGETSVERMTVKRAMEKYIELKEGKLSPSTIAGYTRYANKFSNTILNMPLASINETVIQAEINKMSKGKSTKYMKNLVSFLVSSITMFRKKLILRIDIPEDNRGENEIYEPTDADIKALLTAVDGSKYEIPLKLAMLGMRRSEICALTLEDIGDCSATINKVLVQNKNKKWIIKRKTKNNDKSRTIYIPKELELKIREQGYVYDGYPECIYDYLSETLQQLGIPHFSLHRLRHYYASVSHSLNVPDEYIMLNGGWRTDSVFKKVYRHVQNDRIDSLGGPVKQHFDNLFKY